MSSKNILVRLLDRPEASVRARAIQLLGHLDGRTHAAEFQKACQDPDPMVRASALSALARFFGNENPQFLFPFMSDPSLEVRVEVLAGLLRYGGIEATTRAGVNLLRLQDSSKPEERKEACAVLARLGRTVVSVASDSDARLQSFGAPGSHACGRKHFRPAAGAVDDRRTLSIRVSRNAALTALIPRAYRP